MWIENLDSWLFLLILLAKIARLTRALWRKKFGRTDSWRSMTIRELSRRNVDLHHFQDNIRLHHWNILSHVQHRQDQVVGVQEGGDEQDDLFRQVVERLCHYRPTLIESRPSSDKPICRNTSRLHFCLSHQLRFLSFTFFENFFQNNNKESLSNETIAAS